VTQCTNFWLICLRALNTPPAMEGQVRWFAREDDGERWYTELSRIALELVRADIVGRVGPGKKEIARHHRIFDLRRIMSQHAEDLKATPRIAFTPGRALPPPPALDRIKAARQGEPRSHPHNSILTRSLKRRPISLAFGLSQRVQSPLRGSKQKRRMPNRVGPSGPFTIKRSAVVGLLCLAGLICPPNSTITTKACLGRKGLSSRRIQIST
jgi:hypothetical protein